MAPSTQLTDRRWRGESGWRDRELQKQRGRDATAYCVPRSPVVVVTSHTLPLKNVCEIHRHNLPVACLNSIQTVSEKGRESSM